MHDHMQAKQTKTKHLPAHLARANCAAVHNVLTHARQNCLGRRKVLVGAANLASPVLALTAAETNKRKKERGKTQQQ
jgi:hypothetical protein